MELNKGIIFCMGFILLLGLVSAGSCTRNFLRSCTPDSGYNYCDEVSWTCGDATSHARIQISNPQGISKGGYIVGESVISYSAKGDKLYLFENINSWDNINSYCGDSGCSNGKLIVGGNNNLGSGEIVLTDSNPSTSYAGNTYTKCPAFLVWDRDDRNGWYTYSTIGRGWLGNGNCFNIKSVVCYDNNDCSSDKYCDKSGSWEQWDCKVKECENGQEKCDGKISYLCENNKWNNKGMVKDKCGIRCLNDNDCGTNYQCRDYQCFEKNIDFYRFSNNQCNLINILPSQKTSDDYNTLSECQSKIIQPKLGYIIENNKCVYVQSDALYSTLQECQSNLSQEQTDNSIIYWILIGSILLIIILILIYRKVIK